MVGNYSLVAAQAFAERHQATQHLASAVTSKPGTNPRATTTCLIHTTVFTDGATLAT